VRKEDRSMKVKRLVRIGIATAAVLGGGLVMSSRADAVPTLAGPLPPIGPIGPGPVG
jgi:hypothetical protein